MPLKNYISNEQKQIIFVTRKISCRMWKKIEYCNVARQRANKAAPTTQKNSATNLKILLSRNYNGHAESLKNNSYFIFVTYATHAI